MFFNKHIKNFRLASENQKIELFKKHQVDFVINVKFNKNFSKISAEDFIKKIIYKKINPQSISVSNNFKFGRKRKGDVNLLKKFKDKKLVCTNPDLIVYRGGKQEYCAGKIAEIFENLGGNVVYFGKPHKEIYLSCLKAGQRTLVIGDNLKTDIKGANNMNLDSIFITSGIHKSKTINDKLMEKLLIEYKVNSNYFQKELTW